MDTKKLDQLFIQWDALQSSLKPLLKEQENIRNLIKTELKKTKLDSYTAGKVTATSYTTERVVYPRKKLEGVVPEDLLKEVRSVTKSQGVRVSVAKKV